MPKTLTEARFEGGDVILWKDYIFLGHIDEDVFPHNLTARTNKKALVEIESLFPEKKVIGLQLRKSDLDVSKNALHLDCAFMPLANEGMIIHKKSFLRKNDIDTLKTIFNANRIIWVTDEEMINFACNVLEITEGHYICSKS